MVKDFFFKNKFSLLIAALFILYGWDKENAGVDIQMHDTYFVLALQHITTLVAIGIVLVDIIYFILERKGYWLSKRLKITHTISGVLSLLILVFIWKEFLYEGGGFTHYYIISRVSTTLEEDEMFWMKALLFLSIGLLLLMLILIGANFLRAMIKGKRPDRLDGDDSILDN